MRLEPPDLHIVLIVTHFRGGSTSEEEIAFNTKAGAIYECERLQAEFDDDAAPVRVYVLDSRRVRIHAGGERVQTQRPPRQARR